MKLKLILHSNSIRNIDEVKIVATFDHSKDVNKNKNEKFYSVKKHNLL